MRKRGNFKNIGIAPDVWELISNLRKFTGHTAPSLIKALLVEKKLYEDPCCIVNPFEHWEDKLPLFKKYLEAQNKDKK